MSAHSSIFIHIMCIRNRRCRRCCCSHIVKITSMKEYYSFLLWNAHKKKTKPISNRNIVCISFLKMYPSISCCIVCVRARSPSHFFIHLNATNVFVCELFLDGFVHLDLSINVHLKLSTHVADDDDDHEQAQSMNILHCISRNTNSIERYK